MIWMVHWNERTSMSLRSGTCHRRHGSLMKMSGKDRHRRLWTEHRKSPGLQQALSPMWRLGQF